MIINFNEEEVIITFDGLEIAIQEDNAKELANRILEYFDEGGVWGICKYKEYPQKKDFLRGSQFCHAASMVRKEAFDRVKG